MSVDWQADHKVDRVDYAGISAAGKGYLVTKLPGRRRYALICQEGAASYPVAYFRHDNDALEFRDWLVSLVATGDA